MLVYFLFGLALLILGVTVWAKLPSWREERQEHERMLELKRIMARVNDPVVLEKTAKELHLSVERLKEMTRRVLHPTPAELAEEQEILRG